MLAMLSLPAYSADYVPGDVLVVLKPSSGEGVSAASLSGVGRETLRTASFAASAGAYLREVYPALSEAGGTVYALLHSEAKPPEDLTRELLDNPEVLAASPNYIVRAAYTNYGSYIIPNDRYINYCWGLSYIDAVSAWTTSTGSSSVYVAVVDSGIDDTNPDLSANVAASYGANIINSGTIPRDDNWHGTHVAGTIGAIGDNGIGVAGVCWNVGLIPVKVLDNEGYGTFAGVVYGMNHVTQLIKQGVNIRAVNLSLETYLSIEPTHDNLVQLPLWRAFKDVDALNQAVIVVAAGNYSTAIGQKTTRTVRENGSLVFSPGMYVYPPSFQGLDNMISVGAVDSNGKQSSFSNTGAAINAPGRGIVSTYLQSSSSKIRDDGTSLYEASGTSMAAPHVAGTVALLASAVPGLTAYQYKQAVLDSASSSGSISIVNAKSALDYLTRNSGSLQQNGTDWTDYNDYGNYSTNTNGYGTRNTESDSTGDCNSMNLYASSLMLVVMLVKKFTNC